MINQSMGTEAGVLFLSLLRLGVETFSEGFETLGKTSFAFPPVSFTLAEEANQVSWNRTAH